MKIVILDGYTENPGDLSWESLAAFGDLTVYDRTPYDDKIIAERIGDAEVVFTNKCPIRKPVFDACPNLKYISVLATGYNIVDYNYAWEKGICVSNVPTYGTAAVGQFAIALLLEICHHVAHHSDAVHEGRWETMWPTTATPCTRAAGSITTTGASGTIRLLSSPARPWASLASERSARPPERSRKPLA